VEQVENRFQLLRAKDAGKDQSYFLHRLNQAQLSRVIFPVGDMKKSEVRKLAYEAGLPNHAKKDSTGICFIGERPFRDAKKDSTGICFIGERPFREFLNRYLPKKPGPIRTPEGKPLGQHIGLAFYTIGQRKGIGLGGTRGGAGEAWYVADKRMASNELIVVQGHDHPLLLRKELRAEEPAWVSGELPGVDAVTAKTRYRQADAPCNLQRVLESGIEVVFDSPQWAVTPGQSLVLYDGEVCLGGAVIST
jgi:tRNA-uridine 2-sulfurtransferase